jgi:hypothetical protein
MAGGKTLMVFGGLTPAITFNNGVFGPISGAANFGGTTGQMAISFRESGVISKLAYNNLSGSGTETVRVNKNGASGNGVVSQAGPGYGQDNANTDTIAANDTVQIGFADTGTNPAFTLVKTVFQADADTISHYGTGGTLGQNNYDVASSTRFINIQGYQIADGSTTEANQQHKVRAAGTLESLQVNIISNARTNDSVFRSRINGAFGASIITVGAGVTGRLTDDTNTDALADGDLYCISITLLTGTEDLQVGIVNCIIRTTTGFSDLWFQPDGPSRGASATPHYWPIGGSWDYISTTTESQASLQPGFDGTISRLRCYVSANTYTGSCTIKVFINGVAGLTLTIAAGATGWQENSADTLDFTATDTLSYQIVGGTANAITIRNVGITIGDAAIVSTFVPRAIMY